MKLKSQGFIFLSMALVLAACAPPSELPVGAANPPQGEPPSFPACNFSVNEPSDLTGQYWVGNVNSYPDEFRPCDVSSPGGTNSCSPKNGELVDPQNVSFGWNNPLAAYCSQNGYEFTLEYVADYNSGNVYTGVFQAGTQFGMGVLNYTLPFGLQPNAHYVWSIRFANTQNGDLQDFAYLHFRTGPECVSSQLQVPLFHDPVYKTYA